MSIKVNIYGKDYSPIDFRKYDECRTSYTGVEFKGIEYRETVAQVITCKFLKYYCNDVSKYIIGSDESKKGKTNFSYYTIYQEKLRYENIVGVLQVKEMRLSVQDFIDLRQMIDKKVLEYCLNEDIESEFAKYLNEVYEVKLQIQSRFDGNHTYFLPTMLLQGKIHLTNEVVPSNNDELFKFLLVYWYKEHLEKAYIQGAYRTYQRFEKNDDRFRGSLDVGRHIGLNLGMNNGKIAYSYRENTTDNSINHLILHTYHHIKRAFPDLTHQLFEKDYNMKKMIDELEDLAPSFKSSGIGQVMAKSQRIISHPFYHYYEKLRQTCMRILRYEGISIFDHAEDKEVSGMLFYIPDLWELYLENEMKKDGRFKLETQKEIKIFTKSNDEQDSTAKAKQNTYPDFIYYSEDNTPVMVLDAKFKEKWGEHYIAEEIVLEDYTKCIRDMNSLGAHATGVIFPVGKGPKLEKESEQKQQELEQKMIHAISSYNRYDNFYSFPLFVPDTESVEAYQVWKEQFEFEKDILLDAIDKNLHKEEEKYRVLKEICNKVEGINEQEQQLLKRLLLNNH